MTQPPPSKALSSAWKPLVFQVVQSESSFYRTSYLGEVGFGSRPCLCVIIPENGEFMVFKRFLFFFFFSELFSSSRSIFGSMLPPPTSVPAPDPSSPPSQVEEAGEQTWQVQGYHQTLQPELGMGNHELTICWAHRWISAEHT